ncbi:MAG: hypothetical protein N3D76_03420 [Geminocystis sp.]|nr:hypothetical protein [Geminocystis sp.]
MNIIRFYHKILSEIETFHKLIYKDPKAGRKPKISDQQIMALLILSYYLHSPLLTLAKNLIDPSINSYHIFRKSRMQKRIHSKLRQYMLHSSVMLMFVKTLLGKKIKLIVDGIILPVANVNRARTQRIRRGQKVLGKKTKEFIQCSLWKAGRI